jgi:hypothetical protein
MCTKGQNKILLKRNDPDDDDDTGYAEWGWDGRGSRWKCGWGGNPSQLFNSTSNANQLPPNQQLHPHLQLSPPLDPPLFPPHLLILNEDGTTSS